MDVKVEFSLLYDGKDKSIKAELLRQLEKLDKYKQKEQFIGNNIYLIDEKSDLYNQIVGFCENNKKTVRFVDFGFEVKITDADRRKAAAFIPQFPMDYCEEYDDITYEYEECEFCYCNRRTDDLFHVQPKGYIKRCRDEYGMAGIDRAGGELLLLPKLVEGLIDGGIHKKYFEPVLSKKKKIMGYIYTTDNILPEGALKDSNYRYLGKCPVCGGVKLNRTEKRYWYHHKTITREALQYLKDVNFTYEFYDEYRTIVVSKRVEEIISKYVKNAEFIPIFPEK